MTMKVLKAPEASGVTLRQQLNHPEIKVLKGGVVAHIAQVQQGLVAAQLEAQAIIAAAHQEADAIREAAREQGEIEGARQVIEALKAARGEYDRLLRQAEPDMLELAFGLASRLVRAKIEVEPTLLQQLIYAVLEQVRGKRQVVVCVHPDDLALVESWRGALSSQVEGAALYLEADERVGRGGCVVETEAGRVDGRLEVQLGVMRKAMGLG
jgi:flagellar biosynthesis/type III secretory pathway protein FliH